MSSMRRGVMGKASLLSSWDYDDISCQGEKVLLFPLPQSFFLLKFKKSTWLNPTFPLPPNRNKTFLCEDCLGPLGRSFTYIPYFVEEKY